MNKFLLVLILLTTYSCGIKQYKEVTPSMDEQAALTKEQYAVIHKNLDTLPDGAQIAIAIIDNGDVNYYGIKRENDSTLIVNNHNSVFEIGSITKVFTGTLLSNYVVDEKVGLDNNITDYLEFSLKDNVAISLSQLATHTSGLPRIPSSMDTASLENPYKSFGEKELKTYLTEELEMAHNPGDSCDYSNLGGGLLGYVLSKVDNTSYEDMLQVNIFSRYQMNNSTTNRSKVRKRLIKGRNDKGEEVSNWDMSVLMGAGGILSTVEDLSKFALAQFDDANKELNLTRESFYKVSESYSMGLGWSVITTGSGADWNWHNGGTGGYSSSMIIDTNKKDGVIILSNISALGELTGNITSLSPALMGTLE